MVEQHPISPPSELVQQWINEEPGIYAEHIAARAAQWGADQELKACCEWLRTGPYGPCAEGFISDLRASRRPRPLRWKEQALALLQPGETRLLNREQQDVIRQALEALPDE
jgi:hypothetical protein